MCLQYGNPEHNAGKWYHWNHSTLSHWNEEIQQRYPSEVLNYVPPHDVHSAFYPARGPYSSSDRVTVGEHMMDMKQHGISVAAVSWWGRPHVSSGDSQGVSTDEKLQLVFDEAAKAGMKIALHLEPYDGRDIHSIALDLAYITEKYASHPAMFRVVPRQHESSASFSASFFDSDTASDSTTQTLPFYYVYDSYQISPEDWKELLTVGGTISIRNSKKDGFFAGLWLYEHHGQELFTSGFDAAYTYFATDGFSFGSTVNNWKQMNDFCNANNMLFIPSISPGYDDTKIRPWNSANKRPRDKASATDSNPHMGAYYQHMFNAALKSNAQILSITSFNEWGEGTQIESAVEKQIDVDQLSKEIDPSNGYPRVVEPRLRQLYQLDDKYSNYSPENPNFFLLETKRFSHILQKQWKQRNDSDNKEL
jgi:glycoprotein endo-alpha-1,2-mannosidase